MLPFPAATAPVQVFIICYLDSVPSSLTFILRLYKNDLNEIQVCSNYFLGISRASIARRKTSKCMALRAHDRQEWAASLAPVTTSPP